MNLKDYDFKLPQRLIAQKPAQRRDQSRLLVLDRKSKTINHSKFSLISEYLQKGDMVIFNNSKVFPARLFGEKQHTGGRVEILLNRQLDDYTWEAIGKGLRIGTTVNIANSHLQAAVISKSGQIYKLLFNLGSNSFFKELDKIGIVPLPPYIRREGQKSSQKDKERYQTVYAKERGSVAAPTAGLHFTADLIKKIKEKKIKTAELTLHVGLGTFSPIKEDDPSTHKMHKEYYNIPTSVIKSIINTKKSGGRVIAVGTTTCRVLETIFADQPFDKLNNLADENLSGHTEIFIYPPYNFKCVDGLITNFHLPKSSLMLLVSAFAGRENILSTYNEAVAQKYRFFSYGDAMLII